MVIHLDPKLAAALAAVAKAQGVTAEELALATLRGKFAPIEPQDEWERKLLALATDWGVSLPNSALSSEGIYD